MQRQKAVRFSTCTDESDHHLSIEGLLLPFYGKLSGDIRLLQPPLSKLRTNSDSQSNFDNPLLTKKRPVFDDNLVEGSHQSG